ncbi:MAG: Arc family DNA-binding protein, partial [Spirochaetia bacterium]|jgi:hypothetical protein|nr:Arc family DNA-binding protein [Spirochaetia bacterium]
MDQKNEKDKKQILLRLSPQLWRDVAAWAEEDFRSINGQIEYLLHEAVHRRKKTSDGGAGRDSA